LTNELDRILISSSDPAWRQRMAQIHAAVRQATYFEEGGEQDRQLNEILRRVREDKDEALAEFTQAFDNVSLAPEQFRVSQDDLAEAHRLIDAGLSKSIRQAIENVRKYQQEIFIAKREAHPGIKYTVLKRAGLCVPGASAPLPSTVIMTAVPAQAAGVRELVVVSPPRYNGSIHPVILAVCHELGIDEVYRIGGAHAVAALAYGTQTIRRVDKIVGPGNQWVQMAKRKVFGQVDIDSIAGPSEVLIIANDKANPAWAASDMLSQAEHAPGSAVLFTDSQSFAEEVLKELKKQTKQLSRAKQTMKCLTQFSGIVVFGDMTSAVEQANEFAAEHLQIQCGERSREIADKIENAGAIFIGEYTPVAVGDYWAGPSHTLPTGQTARFFSPLSANDFVKSTSIIEYDREQLAKSAADIIRLAETEGLDAHARSVRIRQES
jgi:histidinol dehydrogenase